MTDLPKLSDKFPFFVLCRPVIYSSDIGPRGMPSEGAFLKERNPYLCKEIQGNIRTIRSMSAIGFELSLPVLRAVPFGHWWGNDQIRIKLHFLILRNRAYSKC